MLPQNAAARSTIDDVITLFAPVGGTTRASLSFRVGTADEPLPLRGITHLIGHLASAAAGQDPAGCPLTVSASTTTFHCYGNALAVANEIGAICHWIGAATQPTGIDERAFERARQAAIADQRSYAAEHTDLLAARFGPGGWASGSTVEHGLRVLTREQVADWVRRHFVRGNCALAVSGTKATTLRVPLPPGDRVPFPALADVTLATPALVPAPSPRLSVGGLLTTTPATLDRDRAAAALLTEIARARAAHAVAGRFGRDVQLRGGPMALGHERVHAAIWGEVTAEQEAKVADLVAESVDVLADRGLVEGELPAHVKRRLTRLDRSASSSAGAHDQLARQAVAALNDAPWSPALERRLTQTTTAEQITGLATELASSLVFAMQETEPPIRDWHGPLTSPAFAPSGAPHKSRPAYGRDRAALARIHTDRDGLSVRRLAGTDRQLRWGDVVLAEQWDTGRRRLTGARGQVVDVEPHEWDEPDAVVAEIDRATPAATAVRVGPGEHREPAARALADRLPAAAWAGLTALSAVVLVLAAAPVLPEAVSWLRWVLGCVAVLGLVTFGALAAETMRTDRAFGRNNPPD